MARNGRSGMWWCGVGIFLAGTIFAVLEKVFEPNYAVFGSPKHPWLPWVTLGTISLGPILMIVDEIIRRREKEDSAKGGEYKMENEKFEDIDELVEDFLKKTGSPVQRDMPRYPTLADIVNVKLARHNYKSSERVFEAVELFNKTSTKLTKWIITLTIVMIVLVAVQVGQLFWLKGKQQVPTVTEQQSVSEVVGTEGGG